MHSTTPARTGRKKLFVAVLFLLGHGLAVADIVRGGHRELVLQFDLTGRQHAAVQFDFDALITGNASKFRVVSDDGSGSPFQNGFKLINPRTPSSRGDTDASIPDNLRGEGFYRAGGSNVFQTAMFNVAAYDGRMIALRIGYDVPTHGHRGRGINLANISIEVAPQVAEAAVVPEPGTIALLALGLAGLGVSRRAAHYLAKG